MSDADDAAVRAFPRWADSVAELALQDGELVAKSEDLDVLLAVSDSSRSAAKAWVTAR